MPGTIFTKSLNKMNQRTGKEPCQWWGSTWKFWIKEADKDQSATVSIDEILSIRSQLEWIERFRFYDKYFLIEQYWVHANQCCFVGKKRETVVILVRRILAHEMKVHTLSKENIFYQIRILSCENFPAIENQNAFL